jgi:hypothetical protein
VNEKNVPAGLVAIACAVLGGLYIVRVLVAALQNGFSPGKLGAVHQAGTLQYNGFLVICVIGIVLMLGVAYVGACWAGFIDRQRE